MGSFQCDSFDEPSFDVDCLDSGGVFVGPQPVWPENDKAQLECGIVTLRDLLENLHRPFDKDPHNTLLFRLNYDGDMIWRVWDGRLSTAISGGTGVALDIDLSAYTVSALIAHLDAQTGYSIVYSDSTYGANSALMLIDGSTGNPDTSNGDHCHGYTSLLWAYLSAAAEELKSAKRAICQMLLQMSVATASDVWLDHLGRYYAVPRLLGESDAYYGSRIIAETLRPKGNNVAIAAAIASVTGQVAAVIDADMVTVPGSPHYYDGTYRHDGTITYDGGVGVGFSSYGLFDVVVSFDLMGYDDFAAYRDAIIAQVNRLRDAGTFLRQITIAGASTLEDDDPSSPSDELTIWFNYPAYYNGAYAHNGLITYGGVASPQEVI